MPARAAVTSAATWRIDRAAPADLQSVCDLLVQAAAALPSAAVPGGHRAGTLALLGAQLDDDGGVRLVARADGEVVATARIAFRPLDASSLRERLAEATDRQTATAILRGRRAGLALRPGEALAEDLCVAPAHRGLGIGAGLLAAMLDLAARAGTTQLLLAVHSDNAAGMALHRGAGFVALTGRRRVPPSHVLLAATPRRMPRDFPGGGG